MITKLIRSAVAALSLSMCVPDPPVVNNPRPEPTAFYENDPAPAMELYRIVAEEDFGWTPAQIDARAPFVQAVMARESHFCPNVIRGDVVAPDCTVTNGRPDHRLQSATDSGFGQVLMSVHSKMLCPSRWHLCTREDVVASPRASMRALLELVDRYGRQPWCYTARLRAGSVCRSWGG